MFVLFGGYYCARSLPDSQCMIKMPKQILIKTETTHGRAMSKRPPVECVFGWPRIARDRRIALSVDFVSQLGSNCELVCSNESINVCVCSNAFRI